MKGQHSNYDISVQEYRTEQFDFNLPSGRIATEPLKPRDSALMLEIADRLTDRSVQELPNLLSSGDTLIINDTRVIPARLRGKRGSMKVEVMLHKAIGERSWLAFARPARRLSPGDIIHFSKNFTATINAKNASGEVSLRFNGTIDIKEALLEYGETPLPPYISRPKGLRSNDSVDYQTVYAKTDGAVAAPTAGLHFTAKLLEKIADLGVNVETVTLHVGAGTFLPVKVDKISKHVMHSEWGEILPNVASRINEAKASGGRTIAVGTTVLRLIETAAEAGGLIKPFRGETDIFITPGYKFCTTDALITNFHLPRSTLLMLVAAFAGLERIKTAYEHAINKGYRFYSYGDCSFIHRAEVK